MSRKVARYTSKGAAAALWRLYSKSTHSAVGMTKEKLHNRLHSIAEKNPAASHIPRCLIDGAKWPDAAADVLFRASCWRHGVSDAVSEELLTSFVHTAQRISTPERRHNDHVLSLFVSDFDFRPAELKLPMLPVSSQVATLLGLWRQYAADEPFPDEKLPTLPEHTEKHQLQCALIADHTRERTERPERPGGFRILSSVVGFWKK